MASPEGLVVEHRMRSFEITAGPLFRDGSFRAPEAIDGLVHRRGRRSHRRRLIPCHVLAKELSHQLRDGIAVRFQGEVARVERSPG